MESGDDAAGESHHNDNEASNDGASRDGVAIWSGTRADYVSLKVAQGLLWVTLEREPTGDDLRSCFERALASRTITKSMRVLVDMTRFSGSVDWSAIHAIRDMGPWGEDGKSRVAYVTRDTMVNMLLRVVADLFPFSQHRFFHDREAALAWLRG